MAIQCPSGDHAQARTVWRWPSAATRLVTAPSVTHDAEPSRPRTVPVATWRMSGTSSSSTTGVPSGERSPWSSGWARSPGAAAGSSNDNPYSESQFKTLKYRPNFPGRFTSIEHARAHCQRFFAWYNDAHRHGGLGLHTPADVHYGRVQAVQAARAGVPAAACAAHPERFVRQPPQPPKLPTASWINKPEPPDATATPVRRRLRQIAMPHGSSPPVNVDAPGAR